MWVSRAWPPTGCMFCRARSLLHVFPLLMPVLCFPALATGRMFSPACHCLCIFPGLTDNGLHVFPRSALIACFPALGTGSMLFLACHCLYVFPALDCQRVARFPALGAYCMFSRYWCRFYVFPRLAPVACYLLPVTACMFFRPCNWSHALPRYALAVCLPAVGTGGIFFFFFALGTASMFSLSLEPCEDFFYCILIRICYLCS